MKRIINGFIALTLVFATLLTLTACGKKKKDEQPTKTEEPTEEQSKVHECSYDKLQITEYPSFSVDGKGILYCSCGKASEQTLSWKENVIFKGEDITIDKYDYTDKDVENIINDYKYIYFGNAARMYSYDNRESFSGLENTNSYLDSVSNGQYTISVNRYTGVMYYKNNTTGEIIASNQSTDDFEDPMLTTKRSQLAITYTDDAGNTYVMNNIEHAVGLSKVETTVNENGIKVSYILGDTNERLKYAIPMWIEAHEFEKDILRPMMNALYEKMLELLGEEYAINYFEGTRKIYAAVEGENPNIKVLQELDEVYYDEKSVYEDRFLHDISTRVFFEDFEGMIMAHRKSCIEAGISNEEYLLKEKEVINIATNIEGLIHAYQAYNPSHPKFKPGDNTPQKVLDGTSMYCIYREDPERMELMAEAIKKYCPDYTLEMMLEDEKWCEYPCVVNPSSAFKIDVEYIFNDDGSFSVNLISDSIIYNDVYFILQSVELMHDYGNGKITSGEHIFLPSEA